MARWRTHGAGALDDEQPAGSPTSGAAAAASASGSPSGVPGSVPRSGEAACRAAGDTCARRRRGGAAGRRVAAAGGTPGSAKRTSPTRGRGSPGKRSPAACR